VNVDGSLKSFGFCSHYVSSSSFHLTTWEKTLYRYLSNEREDYNELELELGANPQWPRIKAYLSRIGRTSDKIKKEEEEKGHSVENGAEERKEPSCDSRNQDGGASPLQWVQPERAEEEEKSQKGKCFGKWDHSDDAISASSFWDYFSWAHPDCEWH